MKKPRKITHRDIRQALDKFKERGGLIKKLPDAVTPRNAMVGADYGMFETLRDNQPY